MAKEVFQARRQVRRGVEPRIHRGGSYVALRAVTNVFLRDLNVALVVEAMMKGSRSIYVDFVDYDEIAHHAGVTRSESLAAFYGLDDAVRSIEQVIEAGITPRPYHVVLVSDHGQSQGATFLQRYGVSLEDLDPATTSTASATVTAATGEVEAWGPVNMLHRPAVRAGLGVGPARPSAPSPTATRTPRSGPSGITEDTTGPGDAPAEITVVGSGNLGGVWFSQHPRAADRSTDIERLHPGLLAMLAAHPGIGFVVVATDARARGPRRRRAPTTSRPARSSARPARPVRRGCRGRLHPRLVVRQRAGHLRQLARTTPCSTRWRPSRSSSAATAGSAAGRPGR